MVSSIGDVVVVVVVAAAVAVAVVGVVVGVVIVAGTGNTRGDIESTCGDVGVDVSSTGVGVGGEGGIAESVIDLIN